ncbi:uncharacterized protein O3C94_019755 [Discoglossus pictus]
MNSNGIALLFVLSVLVCVALAKLVSYHNVKIKRREACKRFLESYRNIGASPQRRPKKQNHQEKVTKWMDSFHWHSKSVGTPNMQSHKPNTECNQSLPKAITNPLAKIRNSVMKTVNSWTDQWQACKALAKTVLDKQKEQPVVTVLSTQDLSRSKRSQFFYISEETESSAIAGSSDISGEEKQSEGEPKHGSSMPATSHEDFSQPKTLPDVSKHMTTLPGNTRQVHSEVVINFPLHTLSSSDTDDHHLLENQADITDNIQRTSPCEESQEAMSLSTDENVESGTSWLGYIMSKVYWIGNISSMWTKAFFGETKDDLESPVDESVSQASLPDLAFYDALDEIPLENVLIYSPVATEELILFNNISNPIHH